MLTGLFFLLVFLVSGELIRLAFSLPVPGSIIGMILLLICIVIRRQIPANLQKTSTSIMPLLPLFIIPVSAGLITQWPLLEQHGLKLLAILFISLIPGALVTALILRQSKS